MPADEDKYPVESDRRRFVKGVVGSSALAGVATGGGAAINLVTSASGAGGGITTYIGIRNTDGPAPRGMPIVPITIDGSGEISGYWPETSTRTVQGREITVAEEDLGGVTYSSEWFQYCGVQTYAGAQPDADQDNTLRVTGGSPYDWQSEFSVGDPFTIDMFDDYQEWTNLTDKTLGKPALASWRSEGDDVQTMPVQILRSPEVPKMVNGEGEYSEISSEIRSFLDAATEQSTMAWLDKCTHFCCVPAFKAYDGSERFGAADRVYCQCHQSVYNPFDPIQKNFTALPRPLE
jgi:Rieske Fe-S protein